MHKAKQLSLAGAATSIFVASKLCLSCQNYVSRDKTLSRQYLLSKSTNIFVATNISRDKSFVATSIHLSRDTSGSSRQ